MFASRMRAREWCVGLGKGADKVGSGASPPIGAAPEAKETDLQEDRVRREGSHSFSHALTVLDWKGKEVHGIKRLDGAKGGVVISWESAYAGHASHSRAQP